jgi:hypothetical protein
MGWGEFDKLEIMAKTGDLLVRGPYRPGTTSDQEILGDVVIGFLIIQNDNEDNPTVVLDGVAQVSTTDPPDDDGSYEWAVIVPKAKVKAAGNGIGIQADKPTRAIGTAVQVTRYMPADPTVPPGVTMFTWCVGRAVTQAAE